MPTPAFFQNYIQVVAAVEICLEKKLQMPALILIYTLMDSFAWAVYGDEQPSRKRFEAWAKDWMLPHTDIACEPADLYAARCGILHTLTSEAVLTQAGKAKRIAYAWGSASPRKLHQSMAALGTEGVVAVHIAQLFAGVREGMANVMEHAREDQQLRHRLEYAASKHFVSMENEKVETFLSRVHGDEAV